MFGTFTEEALARYEKLVQQDFREKKVVAKQGTEKHTNLGISDEDSSFIDTGESHDADDYSEWDYTQCLRSDGSVYGIADGKKCRKGTETKAEPKAKAPKQKRGGTSVSRDKAEKALKGLQKEDATAKKATERRSKQGKGDAREEQVRQLRAKAFLTMDRLRQRAKKMVAGPRKEQVLARVDRLQAALKRLDKEQQRLRDAAPKRQSEGFGRIPTAYESGRGLA